MSAGDRWSVQREVRAVGGVEGICGQGSEEVGRPDAHWRRGRLTAQRNFAANCQKNKSSEEKSQEAEEEIKNRGLHWTLLNHCHDKNAIYTENK